MQITLARGTFCAHNFFMSNTEMNASLFNFLNNNYPNLGAVAVNSSTIEEFLANLGYIYAGDFKWYGQGVSRAITVRVGFDGFRWEHEGYDTLEFTNPEILMDLLGGWDNHLSSGVYSDGARTLVLIQ
jgi:hypothetical protein